MTESTMNVAAGLALLLFVTAWLISLPIRSGARRKSREAERERLVLQAEEAFQNGLRHVEELRAEFSRAAQFPAATDEFLGRANQIHATLEVGLGINDYRRELAGLKSLVETARSSRGLAGSPLLRLMGFFVEQHQNALSRWTQMEAVSSTATQGSWVGGGFGLEGAVKGVLMANILNAFENNTDEVARLTTLEDLGRQAAWSLANVARQALLESRIQATAD